MVNPIVRLDIFQIPKRHIPKAILLMGTQRSSLKRNPEIRFWKLLGTGSGKTFTTRDADPTQWAVLTVFNDLESARSFSRSPVIAQWQRIQHSQANIMMTAISARGTWNQKTPFGDNQAQPWDGLTAALTRAAIKPKFWREFWRNVPPVSEDLNASSGLLVRMGIGEAPLGLQGTFSIWQDNQSITQFASKQAPHLAAIKKTHELDWYSEELFARFKVLETTGSLTGIDFDSL